MESENTSKQKAPDLNPQLPIFCGLVAMIALCLSTFWVLLGYRFSPETYRSAAIARGTVELVWFGLSCTLAISTVVWLARETMSCRRLVRTLLPLTVASIGILLLGWRMEPMPYVAILVFGVACGLIPLLWSGSITSPNAVLVGRDGLMWRWVLGIIIVGLGVYYYCQQLWFLNNLALGFSDMGEMARLMHNTWNHPRESFLQVSPEKHMFFDHFQPGVLPFVPLWGLWPDVKLLIILQVAATLAVALPLYWIGRKLFQDEMAAMLLGLTWLVHPSSSQFIYAASYGLKWGTFCLPLYFVALSLWLHGRWGWALGVAGWAILIKEEAAILVGMFGLYLALFRGERRRGGWLAAAGFGYFLIVSSVVMPWLAEGRGYFVQGYFSGLGKSKWEILLSPIRAPKLFWGRLFDQSTWHFAATLMAPIMLLSLRKPSALFLGSVTFLFVSLWDNPSEKSICYQYQAGVLVAIFFALALALTEAEFARRRRAALTATVVAGVVTSIFLGLTFWSKENLSIQLWPGRLSLVERMKEKIDPEGVLVATQRVAAHFLRQRQIYAGEPFPHFYHDKLPPGTDYVLMDLRDRWRSLGGLGWLPDMRKYQRLITEKQPDLRLTAAEDGLLLYAVHGEPLDARALVETDAFPTGTTPVDIELSHGVKIRGYHLLRSPTNAHGDWASYRIRTFSAVTARTAADLAVRCLLHYSRVGVIEESYASDFQPLGQGIWDITNWQVGKFYQDEFYLTVPPPQQGQQLILRFETAILSEPVMP